MLPLLFIVSDGMFVQGHGKETHDALIALVFRFKTGDEVAGSLELDEVIKPGIFLLDRVGQLA